MIQRLGARIGITSVLHTWGSAMTHRRHVHMIVPTGGLERARLQYNEGDGEPITLVTGATPVMGADSGLRRVPLPTPMPIDAAGG